MLYAISMTINERDVFQDALFSDYVSFFEKFGCTLVFIPNATGNIESYFTGFPIEGIILSGGNDLSSEFTGQKAVDIRNPAPLRDLMEKKLLDLAVKQEIPVLGICRGMQFINCYFGGSLTQNIESEKVSKKYHIRNTHSVTLCDKSAVDFFGKGAIEVNSYHHQGLKREQVSSELKIMAVSSKDGLVEALFHPLSPVAGVQWHPERSGSSFEDDSKLVRAFINRTLYWEKK